VFLNARYAAMSIVVASVFPGGRLRRLAESQLIVDESWALSGRSGRFEWPILVGAGLLLYVFWVTSTLLGALLGDALGDPESLGLDAAFAALFLSLLVPYVSDRRAAEAAVLAAVITIVLIPLAPVAASATGWAAVAAVPVYVAGGLVCHQRPERSFATGGRPWPVCARCAGLYLGAAVMAAVGLSSGRIRRMLVGAPGAWRLRFAAAGTPLVLSWLLERVGLASVSNAARAATGGLLGLAVAAAVMSILPARRDVLKT